MRQIGDMLVWLAVIVVVAAVVYYTPRVANYMSTRDLSPQESGRVAMRRPMGHPVYLPSGETR